MPKKIQPKEDIEINETTQTEDLRDAREKPLEQVLSDVEDIIQRMQQKDISLEDSFLLYQQGIEGLKLCNSKIDAVEKKLLLLNEEETED